MSPRSLRPLAGIQVVSLATNLPGPLAVAGLRDLGAAVIKVEPPVGDALAVAAPSWYAELTQGVEVRRADLKSRSGLEELTRLLDTADVLVTAMRPSAFCRLGLGDLSDRYPRLCHVEIVGYDGADEEVAGHDLTYQARYGTIRPPHLPLVPVADTVGGERAISAALALLLARGQHDSGGHQRITLDAAAYDSAAALRHGLFGDGAPLGGTLPSYNIYATADGHIALGALEPHFEARTREVLDCDGTSAAYTRAFAAHTTAHWEDLAARHDIPLTAVRDAHPATAQTTHAPTAPTT
ncbi:CoA transferase [Dietzia maris]|uniref:CoA transferase n=1 Tax=Dietzia maris TaxID=37915 RepID=UPI00232C30F1|nr:CoA transferase [Dietzia maris]